MTNEQKAQEMAEEYRTALVANTDFDVNDLDLAEEDATRLTLDMAEWKDWQFKKYLEKKRDDMIINFNITQDGDFLTKRTVYDTIINEFFKEK